MYGRSSTSIRSKRDSSWSYAADPEGAPPLPSKESVESNLSRPSHKAPSILIGMESSDSLADAQKSGIARSDSEERTSIDVPSLPAFISRSSSDNWSESVQSAGASPLPTSLSRPVRPVSHRRTSGESSRSRRSLATQLRMARGIGGSDEYPGMLGKTGGSGDRSETASMLTVDEITQEVESRRESFSLAASGGADGGWVVDEDGEPIPIPATTRRRQTSSSLAGSAQNSSGISVELDDDEDDDDEDDDEEEDNHDIIDDYIEDHAGAGRSPSSNTLGEDSDHDPVSAFKWTRTSRTSSVSESRSGVSERRKKSDDEVFEEGDENAILESDEDDDEDDDDFDEDISEEEDEEGGVYQSILPGKEPIKWIKGALIGAGSFGNVFLGMNAKSGLLMAVKQVELPSGDSHNDQRKKSMLEALEREIELLKTMQHENIVQYLDSYADGTHLNIFLEYVPGGSVVALLRNYGAFEEPLVRNFVKQILHGLNFLHDRDIIHRDIKGANILVDNKSCIKISDFGISKKVESDLLVSARAHRPSLQGSVFWMAPEVVKQTSYTRKADIWSLGCLVVEMISGTHPWANLNQMQALFKIGSHAKPEIPEEISPEAVDFLNKTFELDHNNRPAADTLLQHAFITEEFGSVSAVGDSSVASTATIGANTSTAATNGPSSGGGGANGGDVGHTGTIKSRSKAGGGTTGKKAAAAAAAAAAAVAAKEVAASGPEE
jgi:mitogen-activated protein kinase kinase kinase